VPAVTVNRQRRQCTKLRGDYLFNAFALAKVFRARFIEGMIERKRSFRAVIDSPI
jgi:hypothetical protein